MRVLITVFLFLLPFLLPAQVIPAGFPVLEERARINQLLNDSTPVSFQLRPVQSVPLDSVLYPKETYRWKNEEFEITRYPVINTFRMTSKRQYGWGDYGMIPTPGFQWYASGGGSVKWRGFNLIFLPELVYAQNKEFEGFKGLAPNFFINSERFLYWNTGDNPERYGDSSFWKVWWGQSSMSYGFGAFELGLASRNIWWGPGQFNSLTFSNNAQGFPHISINTRRPAKTFLGNIEVQMILGRLESERFPATQSDSLNNKYFKPSRDKWRYLNALVVSWNPKWVKGLHVGGTRTVQTFADSVDMTFTDIFPVFWGLTKQSVGSDLIGQSDKGKSQQITIFGRYVFQKAKAEIYFEFGKRDHALNWREFILNPEHARAYILGFNKLFEIEGTQSSILVRGEMTQQQESVNRYVRYRGLWGGFSWHMNGSVGGFTNYDQAIGVGLPTGSNVQTIEVSKLKGLDKVGVFFERLAYNNDYYYKAQFQFTERNPWVDLSLGFLLDKQFDNLLLSSKLQLIHARNYQWQTDPASTPEFPKGENLTSVMGQVSLVYFWKR